MAAFNFPNSPSTNDLHTENSVTWKWDGTVWKRQGVAGAQGAAGAQGHQGVQGAAGAAGAQGAAGSATISNNADNRVITGGSGTNLNGEANLTFDGSDLSLRATKSNLIVAKTGLGAKASSDIASNYDLIQIGAGGAIASYNVETVTSDTEFIHNAYRHSGSDWKYRYADAAVRIKMNAPQGTMLFENAAAGSANANISFSERMRITSAGDVVIGTTSAARGPLHIHRAATDCYFHITNSTTGTGSGDGFTIHQGGVDTIINNREAGPMRLYTSGTERLRITSAGWVGIGEDVPDLRLHVNGTNALPATTGSTAAGHLCLRDKAGNASHAMYMGVSHQAPWGSWIQAQDGNSLGTEYPLLLNPNGGNVAIGVASPGLKLHIQDGALASAPTPNSNCDMVVEGTTNTGIQFLSSGQTQLRFGDAGSTAAGAIIYSHSDDNFKLNYSNSGALTFNDGSGEVSRFTPNGMIIGGTANTFGGTIPLLELQKSDNATGPKITMYNAASGQAGATCEIQVGHNYREAARIIFGRDNASNWQASSAAAKSNIQFHTNNAGSVNEKVRVGAGDGSYFMVGTTSNRVTGSSFNYPTLGIQHTDNGYNSIGINQIRPNVAGILFKGYQQSGGNYYGTYFVDSNSNVCGYNLVNTSNQTVSYTNSSDYRLKQDDVPISDGITRVKQLRPIRFKWKSNLSETHDGFFAHEVQAVVPEAVVGEKDAMMDTAEKAGPHVIDATKISPQQLDTRYMVPLLTAALKEEIAKREALEARVAALESS